MVQCLSKFNEKRHKFKVSERYKSSLYVISPKSEQLGYLATHSV